MVSNTKRKYISFWKTLHLSRSHGDRWGATDLANLSLHLMLFSASLTCKASQNFNLVHSGILFFQRFYCRPLPLPPCTVPCKIVICLQKRDGRSVICAPKLSSLAQRPRSKFSSGGAKEECLKENFGGGRGGMLVDFYSISLKWRRMRITIKLSIFFHIFSDVAIGSENSPSLNWNIIDCYVILLISTFNYYKQAILLELPWTQGCIITEQLLHEAEYDMKS